MAQRANMDPQQIAALGTVSIRRRDLMLVLGSRAALGPLEVPGIRPATSDRFQRLS